MEKLLKCNLKADNVQQRQQIGHYIYSVGHYANNKKKIYKEKYAYVEPYMERDSVINKIKYI